MVKTMIYKKDSGDITMLSVKQTPLKLNTSTFSLKTEAFISHEFIVTLQYGATEKGILNILR